MRCGDPKDPIFNDCERPCEAAILFDGSSVDVVSPIISVRSTPVHIVASPGMPEDHVIVLERSFLEFGQYSGDCQDDGSCPDMPWGNVPCGCGCCDESCGIATLFNIADPNCPEGRNIQNDLWLLDKGDYRLRYIAGTPGSITVYAVEDCMREFPPENKCPPECIPLHVEIVSEVPIDPPDCKLCESPIKYNPTTKCTYYWVAPPASDCKGGEENGHWEELCECCPDTTDAGSASVGGSCFVIPAGTSLWDSRSEFVDDPFFGPFEFVFDYTNNEGVIQYIDFDVRYFCARYLPSTDNPAQVFFAFGPQAITDDIFDNTLTPGPYLSALNGCGYAIHDIPLYGQTYPWFGIDWPFFPGITDPVQGFVASGFALNIKVPIGGTINYRGFFAVGFNAPSAGVESMFAGINVSAHIHDGACYNAPCQE